MLSCNSLSFGINGTQILDGVTFNVARGETVGIIGPNGSGKTTLFNCLSGFVLPTAGQINLKNIDITKFPPHRRAELGLGRVFQNSGIFKEMTVLENMMVALEGHEGLTHSLLPMRKVQRLRREMAQDELSKIGLSAKALHKAGSLSGGQLRLLEISRILAFGAEVFLLDEPTAGVSPKMKGELGALIMKLKEAGRTILIIEHDINFVQRFCERIIVLDVGKIVLSGPPNEVRQSKVLQQVYFGSDVPEAVNA